MKTYSFKLLVVESGRMITSEIKARNLVEARILIRIMFRVDEEITKLVGVPKEILE